METPAMRIAVLVSLGRNPVSGVSRASRDDLLALELARRLGGEITVFHAGDSRAEGLADYLAYGAASLEVVTIAEGDDVVAALAGPLGGFDLVLTGRRSEGGEGSGTVPYLLAKQLGLPLVGQALELEVATDRATVTQFLPKGQRRRVEVKLPAVIAAHPMAPVTPRYAFARRAAGRIIRHEGSAIAPSNPTIWDAETAARRPVRFKAAEAKGGHGRMLAAIATESKGGAVVELGTPAEKAEAILTYLREHRLIDW
jgi:electron transfer flavoprotein beta subunit